MGGKGRVHGHVHERLQAIRLRDGIVQRPATVHAELGYPAAQPELLYLMKIALHGELRIRGLLHRQRLQSVSGSVDGGIHSVGKSFDTAGEVVKAAGKVLANFVRKAFEAHFSERQLL